MTSTFVCASCLYQILYGVVRLRPQMDKALELKENRLHSLYTRVNTAHTTGAELRVKINNLRREKLAFEGAHR